MINSINAHPAFLDRPRPAARHAELATAHKVSPSPKAPGLRAGPQDGPSAAFMAQVLAQRDDTNGRDGIIDPSRRYSTKAEPEIFGPDVDILPLHLPVIDLLA